MLQLIEEIKLAQKHQLYYLALAAALTLPDICIRVEFPKYEARKNGERYATWFEDHVYKRYKKNIEVNFDGQACWQLRCAVLHSSNLDLKNAKIKKFNLCIYDKSGSLALDKFEGDTIFLDLLQLISNLVHAAEDYYHESSTPELFEEFSYQLQDYSSNKGESV